MFEFLLTVAIAGVAGSIGARLAGRGGMGCLTSVVLGFIGALLGRWIADQLGLPEPWRFNGFPVVWAVIGAAVFVAILTLVSNLVRR